MRPAAAVLLLLAMAVAVSADGMHGHMAERHRHEGMMMRPVVRTAVVVDKNGQVVGVMQHMHASMALGRRGGPFADGPPAPISAEERAAIVARLDDLAQAVHDAGRCGWRRAVALARFRMAAMQAAAAGVQWDPKRPQPAEQQATTAADEVSADDLRQRLFGAVGSLEEARHDMEAELEAAGMSARFMRHYWRGQPGPNGEVEGEEEEEEERDEEGAGSVAMMPMMRRGQPVPMMGRPEQEEEEEPRPWHHEGHHCRHCGHHHHHHHHGFKHALKHLWHWVTGRHHHHHQERMHEHMHGRGPWAQPLLPGVPTPAAAMAARQRAANGAAWTELQDARPAPPPSWSLFDDKGGLNVGLVAFVALTCACVAVWAAMLAQWAAYRSARDHNNAAEVLALRYAGLEGDEADEADLKPLLHEGPIKGAIVLAHEHVLPKTGDQ